MKEMKAGRNDPCPCGSGKKHKKCCLGKNSQVNQTQPSPDIKDMLRKAWARYRAGHLQEAAVLYQAILDVRPKTFEAIHILSEIASTLGQFKAAEELLRRAIKLQPKRADLHNNLGYKLQQQNRPEEAVIELTKSIRLDPKLIHPYVNRSNVYIALGRVDDSIADSRKALELDPEDTSALRNLLFASNYSNKLTPKEIFNEHVAFGRRYAEIARLNTTVTPPSPELGDKIRIGYLSPDFREHSVAFFLEPVLKNHDKEKFTVFGYSNNRFPDETTRRLRSLCDVWRETASLSDSQLAEMIRDDNINILIDLAGYTGSSRVLVMVHKPAPVQITWLGYPNTTGLEAVDYRITDAIADPPELTDHLYTEKQLRLPGSFICYQAPKKYPEVANPPCQVNGWVTFGSFNNLGKISDALLSSWSHILKAVPNAKLLLKNPGLSSQQSCATIMAKFDSLGIDSERILLRGNDLHRYEHLSRYGEIDIALDTFPYNGTTTTCEALWMGVPVVTFAGDSHRARVGASILHNINKPELVGKNSDDYIRIAAELASNPQRIANYRLSLREEFARSVLMDARRFMKNLEECLSSLVKESRPAA